MRLAGTILLLFWFTLWLPRTTRALYPAPGERLSLAEIGANILLDSRRNSVLDVSELHMHHQLLDQRCYKRWL
ncbi:hypothetical protein GYMLUDRAFT_593301 [Collybiopsis luxurians FD-317 M1]|uniref:Uncharacterized protein n=1 Tax=Collybiopsis luxurians FD-317 M1 TaxID=944289 RepID=A0A0D0BC08_9AGAR|nr:hypothetical protein GYMLUDRAFT_593301 [Collybiopsis luxurians FD-317 M1]